MNLPNRVFTGLLDLKTKEFEQEKKILEEEKKKKSDNKNQQPQLPQVSQLVAEELEDELEGGI